jgi:hypothetical protein
VNCSKIPDLQDGRCKYCRENQLYDATKKKCEYEIDENSSNKCANNYIYLELSSERSLISGDIMESLLK